jgi:hypothetical protein
MKVGKVVERLRKWDKKYIIILIGIFCLSMSIVIYYMNQKSGYHIDEIYSYGLSNNHFVPFLRFRNEWVNSSLYRHYITVQEAHQFRYDSVIHNQIRDVHPPLFYLILHTISSYFPNVFSKWIGLSLNIVVHVGIFFSLKTIVNKLIKSKWMKLIALTFYLISLPAISNLLFIRMYGMLTLFSLLLLLNSFSWIESRNFRWTFSIPFILIIILGSLTHYYFFLYLFFVTLVGGIILFNKKEWILGILFWISSLIGLGISFGIFPAMLDHLFLSDRGIDNSEMGFRFASLYRYLEIISEFFFGGYNWIYLLFLIISVGIFITLWKDKKQEARFYIQYQEVFFEKHVILLIPTYATLLLISSVAPYEDERYIFYIAPMIAMSLLSLFDYGITKKIDQKFSILVISIGALLFTVIGHIKFDPSFVYAEREKNNQAIEEISDLDVVLFLKPHHVWRQHTYISELAQFDGMIFPALMESENIEDFPFNDGRLEEMDEVFMIVDYEFDHPELFQSLEEAYGFTEFESLYSHGYAASYHVKK